MKHDTAIRRHRHLSGSNSVGRVIAFQAICRGFETRLPLQTAHVAQSAERVLGKDEVTSSNLVVGSRLTDGTCKTTNGPNVRQFITGISNREQQAKQEKCSGA